MKILDISFTGPLEYYDREQLIQASNAIVVDPNIEAIEAFQQTILTLLTENDIRDFLFYTAVRRLYGELGAVVYLENYEILKE